MEGSSSNASALESELVKKITDVTQNLHQFMSLVSIWKVENDAQRVRLDQMAADLQDTITTIDSVVKTMNDRLSKQSKASIVAPEPVKESNPVLKPCQVKIKQENVVNDSVVQPKISGHIAPKSSAVTAAKMVPMAVTVRLDRIHPIEIKKEFGAITISSVNPAVSFPAQAIKRCATDTLPGPKQFKSRRLSFSQSALLSTSFGVDGIKKEAEHSMPMWKKRSNADASISDIPSEPRRLTRSQVVLEEMNNLLAELGKKK